MACEYRIQQETILPGQTYARVSSEIAGLRVTVNYTVQVLNIRPTESQFTCDFELVDGEFKLDRGVETPPTCEDIIAEGNALLAQQVPVNDPRRQNVIGRLQTCLEGLQAFMRVEGRFLTYELPLVMLGIYPIAPELTELREAVP